MVLELPSGLKISIPPRFPWDRNSNIVIRSGSTFYPGHVTTKLCLDLMDDALSIGTCGSLLDVGCGSGILSLAAAYMRVSFVVGLDIDPRATARSMENARRNRLSGNTHWVAGSAACIRGVFDCVVANLPFAVIMETIVSLADLLSPRGFLILSGFQDIDFQFVNQMLISAGLKVSKQVCGDLSFYGVPPSGSFTWMGVLARTGP